MSPALTARSFSPSLSCPLTHALSLSPFRSRTLSRSSLTHSRPVSFSLSHALSLPHALSLSPSLWKGKRRDRRRRAISPALTALKSAVRSVSPSNLAPACCEGESARVRE